MKFKQYADAIAQLAADPATHDLEVIYAIDDEGNAYMPVPFGPTLGHYEDMEFSDEGAPVNAVCIN